MTGVVASSANPQHEALYSLVAYTVTSISIILVNKLVMTTHKVNEPIALLFLQNLFAVVLVLTLKMTKMVELPALEWRLVKNWLPLTLLFVAMLYTSMVSLHLMSVASLTLMKNLSTVLTAVGDWYFFGKQLTLTICISFGVIMLGSYLSATGDPWVTTEGLLWTSMNVVASSGYLLYMKLLLGGISKELGRYGTVFYNNFLSLPFLLFPALGSFSVIWARLSGAAHGEDPNLLPLFAIFIALGGVMPFAVFWCMDRNTPTTFAVAGTLGKFPMMLLGVFIFSMWPSGRGWLGIFFGVIGGVMYAYFNSRLPKVSTKETEDSEDQVNLRNDSKA